jgi:hypothetical protein
VRQRMLPWLLFSAAITSACSRQQVSEYLPDFPTGTELSFRVERSDATGRLRVGRLIWRVESDTTIRGKIYRRLAVIRTGLEGTVSTMRYVRYTPTGVYSIAGDSPALTEYLDYPLPLDVGATYTANPDGDDVTIRVAGFSTVPLEGTTYENCLRLVLTSSVNGVSVEETQYLAKGVGLVRLVRKMPEFTFQVVLDSIIRQ